MPPEINAFADSFDPEHPYSPFIHRTKHMDDIRGEIAFIPKYPFHTVKASRLVTLA